MRRQLPPGESPTPWTRDSLPVDVSIPKNEGDCACGGQACPRQFLAITGFILGTFRDRPSFGQHARFLAFAIPTGGGIAKAKPEHVDRKMDDQEVAEDEPGDGEELARAGLAAARSSLVFRNGNIHGKMPGSKGLSLLRVATAAALTAIAQRELLSGSIMSWPPL